MVRVQGHDRSPPRLGPPNPCHLDHPPAASVQNFHAKMESDPDAVVRKRLHIAGLTPSVSASDLSQRLGTFGTVITVDGVGALDVLGSPRPFAYVTIEAKSSQLARCMSPLHTNSQRRTEGDRYEPPQWDDVEGGKASYW